ncbi:MAG: acetate/propionate family kinase [Povalibacter sp.]
MLILSINCGSSSIKSALIDSEDGRRLLEVRVENIGSSNAVLRIDDARSDVHARNQSEALQLLVRTIGSAAENAGPVEAVAHRIVHGGERFTRATRIDDHALQLLAHVEHLAPLHNPPALAALRYMRSVFSAVPHVALFDTAFHTTLPPHAREYALPADVRRRYGIRRYGFHGISHAHVMQSVSEALSVEPQSLRIISCHLGAGASVAAIEFGRSIDTSMGMTPLEGLVMATRAGDVDAGVLLHLLYAGMDVGHLDEVLNRRSGLLGLASTNDMRTIESRAAEGDESCKLAKTMYSHRVRKYIGAYAALMRGVDAIAFTAGVGENSAGIRHDCTQGLDFLGASLDQDRNRNVVLTASSPIAQISQGQSGVRIFVVRADEEQAMARETAALLESNDDQSMISAIQQNSVMASRERPPL